MNTYRGPQTAYCSWKKEKRELERIISDCFHSGAIIFWQSSKDIFSLQHTVEKLGILWIILATVIKYNTMKQRLLEDTSY